jgi:hypothetical protein
VRNVRQKDLGLGYARFYIEMVAVQGDAPIAIGGARKKRPRKLAGQLLLGISPALGLPQDVERNRRIELVFEEALVRGRIILNKEQHLDNLRRKGLLPRLKNDRSICVLDWLFCLELGFPGENAKFLAVDLNCSYIKALQTHKRHGLWA